eukprot:g13795.t1
MTTTAAVDNDSAFPWARSAARKSDTKYPYVMHAEANAILNTTVPILSSTRMLSLVGKKMKIMEMVLEELLCRQRNLVQDEKKRMITNTIGNKNLTKTMK